MNSENNVSQKTGSTHRMTDGGHCAGGTERDNGLENPMRFSVRNRRINIQEKLRHPDFAEKQVTRIEIQDGQMYVHWELPDETGNESSEEGAHDV